jgi:hypothetical protein
MADDETRDYAVGYGRPPRRNRFPKGESGNSHGRPKGTRDIAAALDKNLLKTVPMKGDERRVSKLKLALLHHLNKAMDGDGDALLFLVELLKLAADEKSNEPLRIVISPEEARF